ncbi:MAG: alanine--tRNA ligase [Clostridia bacterium]|nr:alanine--tRNA ligase [Clostridia bacterium]
MEYMGLNEIREKFLSFFESKDHLRLKSFPLVPINDKSLLLINSGMAPLKPYFTGEKTPPSKRVTTCQKCIRTPDIERVGKTARHGTFFEMLGDFSFGDYFKNEIIPWAWEFCTDVMKLPVEKLYVTVYENDDEAYELWNKKIGIPEERIVRLGKEDNFWEIGMGPCGPCSEIYFDRGEENGCGKPDCKPGCDCDRFVEFWNLVFTQFDSDGAGNYAHLEHPNIDTGMGLERMACIVQGVDNLFEVDTIRRVIDHVARLAHTEYKKDPVKDMSIRVITDHIRSVTFLVSDGVLASNEGRGYVLRKLLRRAARHGKLLKIEGTFLSDLCETVIQESGEAYPELIEKRDFIKKVISMEEERFIETIDSGMALLDSMIAEMQESSDPKKKHIFSGDTAFKLYDTYGFPLDLTREILEEKGIVVDEVRFEELMEKQREMGRANRAAMDDVSWSANSMSDIGEDIEFKFVGYETFAADAKVAVMMKDGQKVDVAQEGDSVLVVLDTTPFYAEGGGQVGDVGIINAPNGVLTVRDTKKTAFGVHVHICSVSEGTVFKDDSVRAIVDKEIRLKTMRNHSVTHIMQKALKETLGDHITQSGSYVDQYRTRFDFTHFSPVTKEELHKVERRVNEIIMEGLPITFSYMSIDEAKAIGATADFGEKYGDVVRVVNMGDYTIDLCGGTHLDNTAKVGLFKIVSEASVAAGTRRIEAVTGTNVLEFLQRAENEIAEAAGLLKTTPQDLVQRAHQVVQEMKDNSKIIEKLSSRIANMQIVDMLNVSKDIKGVNVVAAKLDDVDMDTMRMMGDAAKERVPNGVAVISTVKDGKVSLLCVCGKDAIARGAHAGKIIKAVASICGGGGGGRPDSATAGGKDASKLEAALEAVNNIVSDMIK